MKKIELLLEEQQNYFMRESFNTLRTNILFSGKNVKTIIITSCMAHEGKTTVTFETARNLAESGKKVLLVDADLRKSVMVSRYTKVRGIAGLSQVLSGQVSINDAICKTQIEGFDIVFAGPYPPNPTELVGSPIFKEILDEKREQYDYILVDAAPLGLVIDAAVMASVCDGAILVLNAGSIKYRFAQSVKQQLQKSGCKILGAVLNQVNHKNMTGSDYYAQTGIRSEMIHDGAEADRAAAPARQQARSAAPTKKSGDSQ
ncbi:MAG: CpsD/CapB family tyrosine-protein kinase [Clostridia bacterium]|nr:CpsD/CapB family tyrosine-protein kinase [Clostridia bacterium]